MEFPDLEKFFQELIDLTDSIAIMNTQYDSDPKSDIEKMLEHYNTIMSTPWDESEKGYFELFSSHFTFHLKIVEEIIKEAREILKPENREYVKKLVSYVKDAEEWFSVLKKKRKTASMAVAN